MLSPFAADGVRPPISSLQMRREQNGDGCSSFSLPFLAALGYYMRYRRRKPMGYPLETEAARPAERQGKVFVEAALAHTTVRLGGGGHPPENPRLCPEASKGVPGYNSLIRGGTDE